MDHARISLAWFGLFLVSAAVEAASAASVVRGVDLRIERTWPERFGEPLSVDELLGVTDLGGVAVSPDARQVAFHTRTADKSCDCHRQVLYVLDRKSGSTQRVAELGDPFLAPMPNGSINGALMTAQPTWSPDGQYLAFMVNRDGSARLRVLDTKKSVVRDIETEADEPLAFVWGAASEKLLYAVGGPNPAVASDIEKSQDEGFLYGPQFLNIPFGTLPQAPRIPVHLAWNADLVGSPSAAVFALKVHEMSSGELRAASKQEMTAFSESRASSAYQSVLLRRTMSVDTPNRDFRVIVGRAAGDSPSARIESSIRGKRRTIDLQPMCADEITAAHWDEVARQFVLVCAPESIWKDSMARFIRVDPRTGKHAPWFAFQSPGIFDGSLGDTCDLARDRMICVEEEPSSPPRLIQIDAKGRRSVLFDPNTALRARHFQRVDRLAWKNDHGVETWGNLVYPAGYVPGSRYPLVIVQYNASGFLRGGTGNEYPIFLFADAGFFVLNLKHPLPPESPELTDTQRAALAWRGDLWRRSVQSSLDLATSYLVDAGFVDADKVAYTGLSGGANQIDYALANGRKIAAVITSTCCTGPENWPAMAANLTYGPVVSITGWANPAVDPDYAKTWSSVSPSLHVDELQTPILANVAQSEMLAPNALWAKMRARHLPMEVYIYPREYHIKTRPRHRASIYRRNVDWLSFWMQGVEDPSPAKADQYVRWRQMRDEWRSSGRYGETITGK